jgi:hypothetical protein
MWFRDKKHEFEILEKRKSSFFIYILISWASKTYTILKVKYIILMCKKVYFYAFKPINCYFNDDARLHIIYPYENKRKLIVLIHWSSCTTA